MPDDKNRYRARGIRFGAGLVMLLAAGTQLVLSGCASAPDANSAPPPQEIAFWPPFPADPHIQFLKSYRFANDVAPSRGGLDELIYGRERVVLPIQKPYGVAMIDGKIYVCDTKRQALMVLDVPRQETRLVGVTGMGRMSSPTDVAIADDGTIYVTDAARGVIFVFGPDERHKDSFGYEGFKPTGIAVRGDELYVAEFDQGRIQVLDRHSGEVLREFGEKGEVRDGQFVWPLGVAVDPEGNIYTTDVMRCRIQKFSPEGELLGAFGEVGNTFGNFVRPKHIAVDRDGIVYVVDAAFNNVQMFNAEDQLLMFYGAYGSHPGAMYLPAGIAVDETSLEHFQHLVHPAFEAQRLIVVTNQLGVNKVSVYALGELKPGKTAQDVATSSVREGLGTAEPSEDTPPPPGPDEATPGDSTSPPDDADEDDPSR